MQLKRESDEASGVLAMRLTGIPAPSFEPIAKIFIQASELVDFYAKSILAEVASKDMTPDNPLFRDVAKTFLLAEFHLIKALEASRAANDLLSGDMEPGTYYRVTVDDE